MSEIFKEMLHQEDTSMANTHIKRCLTSLVFSEIQTEPTMRYHFVSTRITFRRQQKALLRTISQKADTLLGNVRQYTQFAKKYDSHIIHPAIPLLCSHPREKNIGPLKHGHANVHCSSVHKRPNLKTAHTFVNW